MFRKKRKVVEKIKTNTSFEKTFSENHAIYEKMSKNNVYSGKPQMTVIITGFITGIPLLVNGIILFLEDVRLILMCG